MAIREALALTPQETAALDRLIEYNWRDELKDYCYACGDGPDENQRSGHIFETLVVLENALNDTGKTPGQYLEEELLTQAQQDVLTDLCQHKCSTLALVTKAHWLRRQRYYIDARVNVPKSLRKRFENAQKELRG